ncbi:protein of unknown function [Rhodovastum atsumiense]|nr:protein of unknown function [Rhodovastum atsumiense]
MQDRSLGVASRSNSIFTDFAKNLNKRIRFYNLDPNQPGGERGAANYLCRERPTRSRIS